MRKIFIGCLLLWAGHLSAQENSRVASRYMDGRSQAVLRMEIEDEGLVMPCATGPDSCDTYGAREAVVTVVNCKLLIVSQWQLMKCEGPVQYRPLLLRKAEYQQADSFPFPGNNKMWIT